MTAPAWRKVLDRCQYAPDTGCLLVGTGLAAAGYGRVRDGAVIRGTHLVIFAALVGPVPTGLHVGHICHDLAVIAGTCTGGPSCLHRRCVQPGHLGLQTPRENNLVGLSLTARNARATSCVHGHAFTTANTYLGKNGGRACRACQRAHHAARRLRARQTAPNVVWQQTDLLGAA